MTTTAFDKALNEGRIREYALVISNGSGIQRAVILSGSLTGAWTWARGYAAAVSADSGESWSVLSVDTVEAIEAVEQAEQNLADVEAALAVLREISVAQGHCPSCGHLEGCDYTCCGPA